jgi:hypothetical protein
MLIYLAWSGKRSEAVARAIQTFLTSVLQRVSAFYSPSDIEKGARWSSDLSQKLSEANVGIVVVTPENKDARWILFEAGALSKTPGSRVICLALDKVIIEQPLSQFQNITFSKGDIRTLILQINEWMDDGRVDPANVDRVFEALWPQLDAEVGVALKTEVPTPVVRREPEEMMAELLELERLNSRLLSEIHATHRMAVNNSTFSQSPEAFQVGQAVEDSVFGRVSILHRKQVFGGFEYVVSLPDGSTRIVSPGNSRLRPIDEFVQDEIPDRLYRHVRSEFGGNE